jgi:hypothetical protein
MKLAVATVLRNEIDIVRPFLCHLAALFDYARLLDHGSVDGTTPMLHAACAGRHGWEAWRVEVPGHHQAKFAGFAMRHLFETTDVDVVAFLDADEFFDVPDRRSLDMAFEGLSGRTTARFSWSNGLPARLDGSALALGDRIWERRDETPFHKIAITRALYVASNGTALPSSGNHRVEPGDGLPVAYRDSGRILHLPVRSVAQFRQKITIGALGVLARSDNQPHENSHWFDALRRLAAADLSVSDLIHMAAHYGRAGARSAPVAEADLLAMGFAERSFDVAGVPLALPDIGAPPDPWRSLASALLEWRLGRGSDIDLHLDCGVLRHTPVAPRIDANGPVPDLQAGHPGNMPPQMVSGLRWAVRALRRGLRG